MAHRIRKLIRELLPHALWDGIKFGFQLIGGAGLIAALVALYQRIHTHLDITIIVVAFLISMALLLFGMFLGGTRVSTESRGSVTERDDPSKEFMKLQVTRLDARSSDPKVTYKVKLRLVFTNQSGETIRLMPPMWTTGPDDVPSQFPLGYRYQTERTLGSWRRNEWNQQELLEATLDAGWSFTLYIGLCPSVPQDELAWRRATRRLGTLTIPATIGNRRYKWEERV